MTIKSELSPGFVVEEAEDVDTEEVVLATPRDLSLCRALDAVRQASGYLHIAAQRLPMDRGLAANDVLRVLESVERQLEDLERPC
jgi:hypothetical protein